NSRRLKTPSPSISAPAPRQSACGSARCRTRAGCGLTTKTITWWSSVAGPGRCWRRTCRRGFCGRPATSPTSWRGPTGGGGAAFGELASMLALRSGWEQAPGAIKWTWIITDREVEELKERLELIFQRINQALLQRAAAEPACTGMGTTLTGAYTVGPEAFV